MRKERNTFIQTVKEDKRDYVESEIGDAKSDDFFPQVKVKRWDNEVNLSIRYKHKGEGKETVEEKDGKVIWKKGKEEARFYEIDGAHEFEIILDEKPESNVVEFTIQTKGLDFFYQGEPTEADIALGMERPENVIGSYAVYSSQKKINYTHGKNYGVGKICHIYRPKIIDANENWVWADLTIDEKRGIMKIDIPQEFLDSAAYPVIVDPTIGYDSVGASTYLFGDESAAVCTVYNSHTATTGDILRGIKFYAEEAFAAEPVAVSLYRVESNIPTSKFGTGGSINVNDSEQWWDVSGMSDAMTGGHIYGVAYGGWDGNATAGEEHTRVWGDSSSGSNTSRRDITEQSLPATWNHEGYYSNLFSLYAYFEAAPIDINYSYNIFIDKGKL